MTTDRARRLTWMARALHVLDIVVFASLVVAVVFFDKPSWLLFLALPTILLSVAGQLLVFRAEGATGDPRAGNANTV